MEILLRLCNLNKIYVLYILNVTKSCNLLFFQSLLLLFDQLVGDSRFIGSDCIFAHLSFSKQFVQFSHFVQFFGIVLQLIVIKDSLDSVLLSFPNSDCFAQMCRKRVCFDFSNCDFKILTAIRCITAYVESARFWFIGT